MTHDDAYALALALLEQHESLCMDDAPDRRTLARAVGLAIREQYAKAYRSGYIDGRTGRPPRLT